MPYFYFVIFAMVSCFKNPYRRTALVLLFACIINIILLATNFYGAMADLNDYSGIITGTFIDIVTLYAMLKFGGRFKSPQAIVLLLFLTLNTIYTLDFNKKLENEAAKKTLEDPVYEKLISYDLYMKTALSLNILHIILLFGGVRGFYHKGCNSFRSHNGAVKRGHNNFYRDRGRFNILDYPLANKKLDNKK
jgi:hypothetical protein